VKFHATPLAGLTVVEGEPRRDGRGRFVRVFGNAEFAPLSQARGREFRFEQVNLSRTHGRGSLRGLHFQAAPALDAKLIRCLRGRVFDVAVDCRAGSPTFLRWHGVELFEESENAYFLPEGFAHGFQVLTDEAELLYQHTGAYAPAHEGGLRFDDPRLAIAWPLPAVNVSPRDLALPLSGSGFPGLVV
jgi:dTDP-4-dehydrorhamnose 3,5-epimerase